MYNLFENPFLLGMGAQAFNPSTVEAEAGIRLWVQGLCNEFPVSQGYVERPCLKRGKKEKEKKMFGFCQSIAQVADVSTCTCVWGRGKKSITCPSVGSESH